MFTHFLKTAFRFLTRNKFYALLNFLCLSFGLTCAIVAALNVLRVVNYDRFHKNYERISEVVSNVTYFNGDQFPKEVVSASLPDILLKNVPEIESLARVAWQNHQFTGEKESFSQRGIYADPSFMEIFSYPLTRSINSGMLDEHGSIVISANLAMKLFNTVDCIGRTVLVKDDSTEVGFNVTGVLSEPPAGSYMQFDFIIPFSKFLAKNPGALDPGADATEVWALLHQKTDRQAANAKLKDLIKNQESTLNQELFLFPLKERILYYYSGGRRIWREMRNIVTIGSIGFAILLIACFNYVNLAIALNMRRFREAGIRKVAGAGKSSIIFQHLGEAIILTVVALLASLELVRWVVVMLNRAYNGNVSFDFNDIGVILIITAIALLTAFISGIFPSVFMSSANPVNVLKGKSIKGHSFSGFRQGLIVFQFTIPIVIIVLMMIVKVQDGFMRNFDLGFDKDNMLIIPNTKNIDEHSESIRSELLSIPELQSVSFTSCIPAKGTRVSDDVGWDGKDATQKLHFWCISSDYDYGKTVNLKISEGRYFDRSYPADSSCYLINDVAAKVMGYDNPVGKAITLENRKGTIIGVFTGFHALDLAGPLTPAIISLSNEGRSTLLVKFDGSYASVAEKINSVIKAYEQDQPVQPMLYSSLVARTELTTASNLVGIAFIISIMLACMGLYGLASFTAASRTKEIGIRKINGASVYSIFRLLGMNFTKWLTIAAMIALPVAFIAGTMFMSRFHNRPPMPYWTFVAGPLLAYFIAFITVSLQTWRASSRNPVEALRYE